LTRETWIDHFAPLSETSVHDLPVVAGCQQTAAWTKERFDHPIGREKPPGVSGRLETSPATFSFSRWLVGILRAIVCSLIVYVLDIGQYLRLGGGITAQLVGDDGPRNVLQSMQQLAKEFLGSLSIAQRLHQDIEHLAVLIDGAP
jgi:hypothetical protein